MGAYENPQYIPDTSGKAMIDVINNIGVTRVRQIEANKARQSKEFREANARANRLSLEKLKYSSQAADNIAASGLESDSFFEMSNSNIDGIYNSKSALTNAQSAEEREFESRNFKSAEAKQKAAFNYAATYKDFSTSYLAEMNGRINEPGGVFIGSDDTENASEWSQKINHNIRLKNALLGSQLNNEGTGLLPPVEYYQKDDGTVMGKLEGYEDFDVLATINQPAVEIEDINAGLRLEWNNMEIDGKNGQIKDEYLDYENPLDPPKDTTTIINGIKTTTRKVPIKPGVMQNWGQMAEKKAVGMTSAVDSQSEYNNMNALWLSIGADPNDPDATVENLQYKNGKFELTDQSKEMFEKRYREYAMTQFMGKGFRESKTHSKPGATFSNGTSRQGGSGTFNDAYVGITNEFAVALGGVTELSNPNDPNSQRKAPQYNSSQWTPIVEGLDFGGKVVGSEIDGDNLTMIVNAGYSTDKGVKSMNTRATQTFDLNNVNDVQKIVDKYIKSRHPDLTPKEDKKMKKDVRESILNLRANQGIYYPGMDAEKDLTSSAGLTDEYIAMLEPSNN